MTLVAGYRAPTQPKVRTLEPPPQLEAEQPGDLVQLDCFYVGRLSGTQGRCCQYTAIDVASSFVWADVRVSRVNPDVRHTSALVRQVAHKLAKAGWRLQAGSTDNASEFKSSQFTQTVAHLSAKHRFIRGLAQAVTRSRPSAVLLQIWCSMKPSQLFTAVLYQMP